MTQKRIGRNMKKILEILAPYPGLTTLEVASVLFGKEVDYGSKEYKSTYRSLRILKKWDLIEMSSGQLRWHRKTK